jgi:hypothetical protein
VGILELVVFVVTVIEHLSASWKPPSALLPPTEVPDLDEQPKAANQHRLLESRNAVETQDKGGIFLVFSTGSGKSRCGRIPPRKAVYFARRMI